MTRFGTRGRLLAFTSLVGVMLGLVAISASAKSSPHHRTARLSGALAAQLSSGASRRVIVVLRSQFRAAHVGSRKAVDRAAETTSDQVMKNA